MRANKIRFLLATVVFLCIAVILDIKKRNQQKKLNPPLLEFIRVPKQSFEPKYGLIRTCYYNLKRNFNNFIKWIW